MRSFGIQLSNFLIVLIAIERYNALANLRNIKKILLRISISFVIIISVGKIIRNIRLFEYFFRIIIRFCYSNTRIAIINST